MSGDRFRTAVAAGALAGDELHRALLQSLVETARAIFRAKASSIFLLDEEKDELVFEAVAGEGSDTLVGRRLPSSTGIAGWVLTSRQPIVVDDVTADPRFAHDAAESTGYVPKGLMAAPLLHDERALGVLSVLDRPKSEKFTLQEMELLGYFANQASVALALLLAARRAQSALAETEADLGIVAEIAAELDALSPERRESGVRLLRELARLLRP